MLCPLPSCAGAAKLLQDPATSATLFAPTNAAWWHVPAEVDLGDMEALQNVLLFLVAPGQVVMPDTVRRVTRVGGRAGRLWWTWASWIGAAIVWLACILRLLPFYYGHEN